LTSRARGVKNIFRRRKTAHNAANQGVCTLALWDAQGKGFPIAGLDTLKRRVFTESYGTVLGKARLRKEGHILSRSLGRGTYLTDFKRGGLILTKGFQRSHDGRSCLFYPEENLDLPREGT